MLRVECFDCCSAQDALLIPGTYLKPLMELRGKTAIPVLWEGKIGAKEDLNVNFEVL